MSRDTRRLDSVTCDCGRCHFVVFPEEIIQCCCSAIVVVEGPVYGVMGDEDRALYLDDVKHSVDFIAGNTQLPPGFAKGSLHL